jgi:hypothetical protein
MWNKQPKRQEPPRQIALAFAFALSGAAALVTAALLCRAAPAADPRPAATRPSAPATHPSAHPTNLEIDRLVRQLGHPAWRVRERAQESLTELGFGAEPRLRELLRSPIDSQARLGVQRALERTAADRRLGATLVSLHVKAAAPQDVFAELARQGQVPIAPLRDNLWSQRNWPAVTMDVTDRPFWDVVQKVCVAEGLRPLYAGGDEELGRIVLSADVTGEMDKPAAGSDELGKSTGGADGSFLILASGAYRKGPIGTDGFADVELRLTFFADPKWRILDHPDETVIHAVRDDKGRPLPDPEPMKMQAYRPESPVWVMHTVLPHFPADATRLGQLKGSFRIALLEQSPVVEIDNVLNVRNVVRRTAGQAIQLREVIRTEKAYTVRLTLTRNCLSPQDWRPARELQGIQLLDAKGRGFVRGASEPVDIGDLVTYDLSFVSVNDPAAAAAADESTLPAKLVCRLPLEARTVTIPFEMHDLPLEQ